MGKLIGGGKGGACILEAGMGRAVSDQQGSKIQANSLPEIFDAWQQAALDLKRHPEIVEAARGALRAGNLLVAFLLHCLSQPDGEMRRIAVHGLRILERLKDSDVPLDLRGMSRKDFGALGGNPDHVVDAAAMTRPRGARSRPQANRRQSKKTG